MNTTGFAPLACNPAASAAAKGAPHQAGLFPATTGDDSTQDFAKCLEDEQPQASPEKELKEAGDEAAAPPTGPIVSDQMLHALLWTSCQMNAPEVPPVTAQADGETTSCDVITSGSETLDVMEHSRVDESVASEIEAAFTSIPSNPTVTQPVRTTGGIELPPEMVEISPVETEVELAQAASLDAAPEPELPVPPQADQATLSPQAQALGRNIPLASPDTAESSQSPDASLAPEPEGQTKSTAGRAKKPVKSGDFDLFGSSRQAREAAGTSIAKPVSAMPAQMPKDQNHDARPAMTLVPVQASLSSTGGNDQAHAGLTIALGATPDRSFGSGDLAPLTAAGSTERVENLQELVTREVRFFRQSGAQVLEMVVEPAPDTRVKLHLELQAGRVEVVMSCDGGDQSWLRSHWTELQESLSGQGVTLRSFDSVTSSDSRPQFDFQSGSQQQERPRASFLTESSEALGINVSRPSSPLVPSARKADANSRQLLEHWA